jgi:hypothetical protein
VVDDAMSKAHRPIAEWSNLVVRAPASAPWSVVLSRIQSAAHAKAHCRLAISGEEDGASDELLWGDPPPPPIDAIVLDAAGAVVPRARPAPTGVVVVYADWKAPFESVLRVIRDVQNTGARVMIGVDLRLFWDACPFPVEADVAMVDEAYVTLEVDVGEDGRARAVRVISDPGAGFGAAAAACAVQKFRDLNPSGSRTTRFRVHYIR